MEQNQNSTTTEAAAAERVSAWMDDSLSPQESSTLYGAVSSDTALQSKWHEWHLIGDVMRSASLSHSPPVSDRVAERLTTEPIHFPAAAARRDKRQGALSRRRMTYGLATAAAIAFVSVVALAPQTESNFAPALFAGSMPAVPIQPSQLEDPRLRDLLDTHGSMAIRPVSFEVSNAKP